MDPFERLRRTPEWGFHALALAFGGVAVWHLLAEGVGIGSVLEAFIIASLAVIPSYTGIQARRQGISDDGCRRALTLTLGAVVAFAALAVAVAMVWRLEGTAPQEAAFMVRFGGVLGAAAGARTALGTVRSREMYERATQLNTLLKVNQRVLRHNLRNELAVAVGHLDNLGERVGEDDPDIATIRARLDDLLETSALARRVVEAWEAEGTAVIDLGIAADRAVAAVRERHPDADIAVSVPAACAVRAHPALCEAVEELVENAVVHNPPGTRVTVRGRTDGDAVTLDVADTGVGMQRRDREAVFLDEETPLSHGRGLGLVFVYWVVEGSGGDLALASGDSEGTTVRMRLHPAEGG